MNSYDYFTDHEEMERVLTVFKRLGITSRADLARKYDDGSDLEAIDGIGPIRAVLVKQLWTLDEATWVIRTRLPWDDEASEKPPVE